MIDNKVEAIKEHIEEIMRILEIPLTESNKNTPLRVAKMWCNELFVNRNDRHLEELNDKMALFPNLYSNEMVIMKNIDFNSICEHHWLPFSGKVTVGYVPDKTVIGLSKIPRVVKYFSKRPQLQEQLTAQIGDYLYNLLHPKAIFVEIESTHQCVKCRGVESDCATNTVYKYGDYVEEYYNDFKSRV